jgi:hypothetical protein
MPVFSLDDVLVLVDDISLTATECHHHRMGAARTGSDGLSSERQWAKPESQQS